MSYMRGACYIWSDDDRVHVWADDGYDGWDESSWAEGRSNIPDSVQLGPASGIGVRQDIADSYVVMRLAELVALQRISALVDAAVAEFGGNGGCLALQKLGTALVGALEPIALDPAAAEIRDLWKKSHED